MKIEMVNHASVIVESENIRLITDPWIEGTAFDKGWGLLSESKFTFDDFKNITHIWFSHEHPDHFHPPNLKKIPEEYRKKITILFHETEDKKVIEFCRNVLGFYEVIELTKNRWYDIHPDFSILNIPFGVDDSWICIKSEGTTLLNVNDCEINNSKDAQLIKKIVGDVDVLFTQFSYAGWAGNKDEVSLRKKRASEKLEKVMMQIEVFKPAYVIPFASYVWFCHEENSYMNDSVNRIDDVYLMLTKTDARPLIFYPGDVWNVNADYDSLPAIENYLKDYEKVSRKEALIKTVPTTEEELSKSTEKFIKKMKQQNNLSLLKFLWKPINIYITDYEKSYNLSLEHGLVETQVDYDHCDIALTSEALNYCLNNLWGWSTLRINGRLQAPRGEGANFNRFVKLGNVASLNNSGRYLGFNGRFLSFAFEYVGQNVLRKLS
ncbi:MBL fold metallo-hydrolase [Anaerobacillus sp. MEB173]|uniref:MBL fold metallo-hydrolase n=1 Tax=Anaerobacillus sp. MEB173 TaxID=3383345 RepID=UPI003F8DE076